MSEFNETARYFSRVETALLVSGLPNFQNLERNHGYCILSGIVQGCRAASGYTFRSFAIVIHITGTGPSSLNPSKK
jgi:hypothetical protein